MAGDNKNLEKRISELERLLEESKGEARYYQNIAEDSGKRRLREIDQLSGLIAERKRSEEALRKAYHFRNSIIEKAAEGLCVCHDIEAYPYIKFTIWNDRMTEITGYTMAEMNSLGLHKTVSSDPAVRSRIIERMSKMRQGMELHSEEWEITRIDGEKRTLRISTSVFESLDSGTHVLALMHDLTEHKRAESALKASEERLKAIFKAAENVSFLIAEVINEQDPDPLIIEFSPGSEKIFGFKRDEIIGKPVSMLHLPENAAKFPEIHAKMKEGEEGFSGEITLIRKSGEKFFALHSTHPLFDEHGDMYAALGVSLDISEQKKLETQLRQVEKMEAIGTLAGGIAHEFNNALAGVIGNIELLQMEFPVEKFGKYTDPMKTSAFRMVRLTSQLLAYAGGGKYQAKAISLSGFVEDTLPIVRHIVDPEIRLETNLAGDVLNVEADPTQMQMIMSAVLSNSSEAIDGKGKIRISTNNVEVDEAFAETTPDLKAGPHVCLTIEDDGKGMDEEARSRIFEPFFTTKFQGRGLGMAAAYGIIKNHEGSISVTSELGKGTTVRIYFPAVSTAAKEARNPETDVISDTGTILIIEDEDIVMDVSRAMLEKLGYRILEARTGTEALDIAKNFDGDIDLALLDIKLPDMEGGNLYPLIKDARPDLKVIICSGYAIDGPAQKILDAGAEDFLQKPFSVTALSEKLHRVLAQE
ncbi:MAG: PAS domain S-box protein [Deltaproteobacteria bacterium]|nr:PAS domain S-box protein [Deltaproteobacteria bacterium]